MQCLANLATHMNCCKNEIHNHLGQAWGPKKGVGNVQNYLYLQHFLSLQLLLQKHNPILCWTTWSVANTTDVWLTITITKVTFIYIRINSWTYIPFHYTCPTGKIQEQGMKIFFKSKPPAKNLEAWLFLLLWIYDVSTNKLQTSTTVLAHTVSVCQINHKIFIHSKVS
jgi:hypothetical protein